MSVNIQNLSKYYGSQKALNSISLEINKGEIVGFIGPNGAGKSTTLKILTGTLPFDDGSVQVCGMDIKTNPFEIKKKIGYLPENNPLYMDMYIREYLEYVAGIYNIGNRKERIEQVIELTGLQKEVSKKIQQLSKGYKQRVGLAQAIIHDPEVLILDEPTTGLDPNQIVEIRNLIADLGKEKTLILTTHIMQEVEAICNRIVIINAGSIVANDKKANIVAVAVGSPYTVFIETNEFVTADAFADLAGLGSLKMVTVGTFLLEFNNGSDPREQIFSYCAERKIMLKTLQKIEKSLEQVFAELTRN